MKKLVALLGILFAGCIAALAADAGGRAVIPLSGEGWSLWRDQHAKWVDDPLFLPAEARDLSKLPVNPPTGGWQTLESGSAIKVRVPGTVEEYLTTSDYPRPTDFVGVSWWFRRLEVPKNLAGKRFILRFESIRQRAEVYLDGKLVAYDLVGESPFEADVTASVQPGKPGLLAVRVTNPGGNFHWQDFNLIQWGKYTVPPGRGFGGIIGRVNLVAVDPVYISDLYIQNTPEARKVRAIASVRNSTNAAVQRNLGARVLEKSGSEIARDQRDVTLPPGDTEVTLELDAPQAKLWDLDSPNLYRALAELKEGVRFKDQEERTFGFRWFAPEEIGTNAVLRLNGRRIVLRTAISWGYWPGTGLIATPEMAQRQVKTAKDLGLNMLSFHRSIGSPVVLEAADAMGLLYYEEPGGYQAAVEPFSRAIITEKLTRMTRRDRSHPSLIIYNLINEFGNKKNDAPALMAQRMDDMRKAHALDPSRTLTFTSGWANKQDAEEDAKAHMRPFDSQLYRNGWFDNHRAGGPETWIQSYYGGPANQIMATNNASEIFMRGEEGAVSSPPRLEKIHEELKGKVQSGWDGRLWEKQYQQMAAFLETKGLKPAFSSVDALTQAMSLVSMEHQGRRIQGMRMQNLGDCYAVNGWESMPYDNHSGIVDIYRNPKTDPSVLAYYNQPLYIAVTPRAQVTRIPSEVAVDFYVINEKGLSGEYTLRLEVDDPSGKPVSREERKVKLTGGETYGELLVENAPLPLRSGPGMYTVRATVLDASGKERAYGRDQVLGVDWKPESLAGNGAVFANDNGGKVAAFYKKETGRALTVFDDTQGKLDWIVITRPPLDAPQNIDPGVLRGADGTAGLKTAFYRDDNLTNRAGERIDPKLDFDFADGAQPDVSLPAGQPFGAVWSGTIVPPISGEYLIGVASDGGVRVEVNGKRIVDDWGNRKPTSIHRSVKLEAGVPATVRVDYWQQAKKGTVRLQWSMPGKAKLDPERLFERARRDGTALLILENADTWLDLISRNTAARQRGSFAVGKNWVGGVHFVREHPLFRDLPVNVALNWPYQAVVRDGDHRIGLRLDNEELVVGAYRSFSFDLGTAVGVIPCGQGRVVVSTLDIVSNLDDPSGPAEVSRKLLCNIIGYALQPSKN